MSHLRLPILLLISQNSSILFWIKKHLQHLFHIIEAKTESQALEMLEHSAVDVVILEDDVELSDPLTLVPKLISHLPAMTPVLLITGKLKKAFRTRASQIGVFAFLNTELNEEEILDKIKEGTSRLQQKEKTQNFFFKSPPPES